MSIDPNKFGLTPSLLETVKEALKGDQHKLDVAEPKGKLTSADFKKLRGESAKPDYLDFDKDGNKKEPMKTALKQKNEVADGNKANFKANMKEATLSSDIDSDHSHRIKKNLEKHGIESTIKKSPNPGYHEMKFTHPDRKHLVKHVKRYNRDIEDHNESVNEATLSSDIDSDHSARIKKNLEKHGIQSTISKSPNPGYHEMKFTHPDRKHLVKHVKRYNRDIEDHNESVNEATLSTDIDSDHSHRIKKNLEKHGIESTIKKSPNFGYHEMTFTHSDAKHLKKHVKRYAKDIGEETVSEAAPQPNMAAAMDARKSEVQRKIAQKQAAHQQFKAQRRVSGTMKEAGGKCSCGEDNGSKMKCEVHGGPRNRQMVKGGKEQIVVNPPLKEAGELPKKVVTKGHEIAKSLIKHRAKVKSPYAVGMATAKKSAGIKEDAEQVDEISRAMASRYIQKAKTSTRDAYYGSDAPTQGKRSKGIDLALKKKWGDKKYGTPEPKVKATEETNME